LKPPRTSINEWETPMSPDDARTIDSMVRAAARRTPLRPAILYFDGVVTFAELDADSDAFAAELQQQGLVAGDRIMVCLQNVPAFVIALASAAKLGLISVPINPMLRAREVDELLADCAPRALVSHDAFIHEVAPELARPPLLCYAVSPLDRQRRNDPRAFPAGVPAHAGAVRRFDDAIAARRGERPSAGGAAPQDVALLVYTSGTTGRPKGAMILHSNLHASSAFYESAAGLRGEGAILALAPLFHVTGLSGHIGAGLKSASALILLHRFQVDVVIDALLEHRPRFTVAAITALNSLINHPRFHREQVSSLSDVMSGGAPIAPATHVRFHETTGIELRNVYGLTETTGPVTAVPAGMRAPVDSASGSLSIGVAIPGSRIRIVDEAGAETPAGVPGEIVAVGPSVAPGYWGNAHATSETMRPGGLRTGDIGFRDTDGWIYLIDRKKDMINASGFKVWPREVEDVLYSHPAVREAAVIGVPDPHRGETVKAFVSLRDGHQLSEQGLIKFCKERMAAYKYPRLVQILPEIPKTESGKVLRRLLRG
jgi:long-chain acyl-CoA synthetase